MHAASAGNHGTAVAPGVSALKPTKDERKYDMDAGKVRMAFRVAALAFVMSLIVPASAMASGFFVERGILGLDFAPPVYATPVISGDNIIFATRTTAPGSLWELRRFNIVSGNTTVFRSDAAADVLYPSISGDWVVWQQNDDVRAKNIKSGVVKNVTNDGVTTIEVFPASGTISWRGAFRTPPASG